MFASYSPQNLPVLPTWSFARFYGSFLTFTYTVVVWDKLRYLHQGIKARLVRWFRAREVIKVLRIDHARAMAEVYRTDPTRAIVLKAEQSREIAAVKSGQFGIIDRRSWQFPYIPECFSEDHEILTKRGWIPLREIGTGDLFATRSEQGELQWQLATKLYKYRYDGELLLFKNRMIDVQVTLEHRFYGRYRRTVYSEATSRASKKTRHLDNLCWDKLTSHDKYGRSKEGSEFLFETAEKLEKFLLSYKGLDYGFDIPSCVRWESGRRPEFYDKKTGRAILDCKLGELAPGQWRVDRTSVVVDWKDWLAFLGIFFSEGHAGGTGICNRDNRRPLFVQSLAAAAIGQPVRSGNYNVEIAQKKTSVYYNELKKLISRLPWTFIEKPGGGFRLSDALLYSNLSLFGNTYTKRLPQWLKDLPVEDLEVFVSWAVKVDGWYDGRGPARRRNYKTVSKVLADDMSELFIKLGKDVVITRQERRGKHKLGRFNNAPQFIVSERHSVVKGLPKPEREKYSGFVYCISVPNQVICVRRAGVGATNRGTGPACWCGNSLHRL